MNVITFVFRGIWQIVRFIWRFLSAIWRFIRWLFLGVLKFNDFMGNVLSMMLIPLIGWFCIDFLLRILKEGYGKSNIANPLLRTAWDACVTLFLIAGALLPILILFNEWQKWRFRRWVKKNYLLLHPAGAVYQGTKVTTLTELTQFKMVFSVGVFTCQFESAYYISEAGGASAWFIRILFSLYTFLFGWWNIKGFDGVVYTILALKHNLLKENPVWIGDLF